MRSWPRAAFAAFLVGLVALLPRPAAAYPWMVSHGYTACAQCHVDPTGAGTLTAYGRAQSEILLRTHYGEGPQNPEQQSAFLFGAAGLPAPLQLQADVRGMVIPQPGDVRAILMQADARAAVQTQHFAASASLGAVSEGAALARVSSGDTWNLVSREYWAGYAPTRGLLVRAGRMNLPYGIRSENHILFVRSATGTTINDDQQVGLSVAYGSRKVRADVMGFVGNFQVSPDAYRKRGYSAMAGYAINRRLEVGLSSLFATSELDVDTLTPRTFLSEGLFTRASPFEKFSVMAEADFLMDTQDTTRTNGIVGSAVLDYEPVQGLHAMGVGEYCGLDLSGATPAAYRGTAAVQWFFASRLDVRADAGYGPIFCTAGAESHPFGLVQAHFFL